jgi:hypothetical protein
MDILNFISWVKEARIVTTIDPTETFLPVGVKDLRRGDDFIIDVITIEDLASQLGEN